LLPDHGSGDGLLPAVADLSASTRTTMHHDEPAGDTPHIETRSDVGTGWSTALPLLLLGLLALMLLHSCMRT
jgi:hypothetical protein